MTNPYLQLLRPHQYIKNLILFLPAFFSLKLVEEAVWKNTLLGVIAFSFVASAVYIMNDYVDREEDSQHPVKKNRPLASGKVPASHALLIMMALLAMGIPAFYMIDIHAFYLVSVYVFVNVLYSFWLKQIPIIDINIIALGFIIRIATGAFLADPDILLTSWIVLMIFLGALFIGLAKRREDVILASEGQQTRKAIKGYNLEFINAAMVIMASVMIVAYISYTQDAKIQEKFQSEQLYLTVFFVLLGVLRYLQLTFVEKRSGNPSQLFLRDPFLILTVSGWAMTFAWLIYFS
ncbi:MAG: UbiA prenyltransferase family protein [Bacteroidia bacterium]|nr:UbiA prenyltransferase family protein [Bacteroidia bacterium]